MKKKTVNVFNVPGITAIGLIMTLLSTGCGYNSVAVPAQTPPKGSVLEYNADWLSEKLGNYTALQVTARVQNIGEDGVITVLAEVLPKESVLDGQNRERTEVYLRKGEEKLFTFRFWVGTHQVKYKVWTEVIPPPPPPIIIRP